MSAARLGAELSSPTTRATTRADRPSLLRSPPAWVAGTVQYEATWPAYCWCCRSLTIFSPAARAAALSTPCGLVTSSTRFGSPVLKTVSSVFFACHDGACWS